MKFSKKLFSVLLVVISIFATTAISASAATTTERVVANYNFLNKTISSCQVNYTIKGNTLSQKKVTIKPTTSKTGMYKNANAYDFYLKKAYFNYKIYDPNNGKLLAQGQHRFNETFKLPKGNKNYKVEIWSYYQNWSKENVDHITAVKNGRYQLKY